MPWLPLPWEWEINAIVLFAAILSDRFTFDKLEDEFLLYMIINIYKLLYNVNAKKDIVLNIYYCKHGIYNLLQLFSLIGQKVWVRGSEQRRAGGRVPVLTLHFFSK